MFKQSRWKDMKFLFILKLKRKFKQQKPKHKYTQTQTRSNIENIFLLVVTKCIHYRGSSFRFVSKRILLRLWREFYFPLAYLNFQWNFKLFVVDAKWIFSLEAVDVWQSHLTTNWLEHMRQISDCQL